MNMSKSNDRIITELKSRENLIDKKYGEGSTKKLIEFSESLSSLYDDRIKTLFYQDINSDEKIRRLSDIKRRIEDVVLHILTM